MNRLRKIMTHQKLKSPATKINVAFPKDFFNSSRFSSEFRESKENMNYGNMQKLDYCRHFHKSVENHVVRTQLPKHNQSYKALDQSYTVARDAGFESIGELNHSVLKSKLAPIQNLKTNSEFECQSRNNLNPKILWNRSVLQCTQATDNTCADTTYQNNSFCDKSFTIKIKKSSRLQKTQDSLSLSRSSINQCFSKDMSKTNQSALISNLKEASSIKQKAKYIKIKKTK